MTADSGAGAGSPLVPAHGGMTASDPAGGGEPPPEEGRTDGGSSAARRPLRPALLRERLLKPAGPLDRLEVVDRTGSTNTDLATALRGDPTAWGDIGLLATEHQVDGRGRSGRAWQTPPAAALTFSVALRPPAASAAAGWLPLLAGLAVVRAVRSVTGVPVGLKWPNDLMVDVPGAPVLEGWGTQRKVGGILAELVATGGDPRVVVGIGINVLQSAQELPVATAQSLAGAGGGSPDRDELLVGIVRELTHAVDRWRDAAGDVVAAGLADEVSAVCTTLGRPVRVELPGGGELAGTAVALAPDGALLVRDAGGEVQAVRAGDVRHVRGAAAGDPSVPRPPGW